MPFNYFSKLEICFSKTKSLFSFCYRLTPFYCLSDWLFLSFGRRVASDLVVASGINSFLAVLSASNCMDCLMDMARFLRESVDLVLFIISTLNDLLL